MIEGLLGRKIGMTQEFSPAGEAIPVTVIELGPCVVTQVRDRDLMDTKRCRSGLATCGPKV